MRQLRWLGLVAVVATLVGEAWAAPAPPLPTTWINGPPLSVEQLSGKLVVLYYFEETCPTCRGKWPAVLATAKQFEDQPVLFVGVNSGNPPAAISQYAKSLRIDWPIIVDTDRSFEAVSGLPSQISLQNIMQVKVITADGKFLNGNWNDIAGSVSRNLSGAKWSVDPKEIPDSLKPAWRQLEFCNYSGAGSALAKVKPTDDATRQAAAKLKGAIIAELNRRLEEAKELESKGQKWQAFKAYGQAYAAFKPLPEVRAAADAGTLLKKDKQVAREIKAASLVGAALRGRSTGNPAQRDRAEKTLKDLAKEYADTEAGKLAAQPPMP